MNTEKQPSLNFKYVDCVSGVQHINNLYHHDLYKYEEFEYAVRCFRECYFDGCVSSKCGRSIISTKKLLGNIYGAINDCKDWVIYPHLAIIIKAALKGVWDNCSLGQYDSYTPLRKTRKPK